MRRRLRGEERAPQAAGPGRGGGRPRCRAVGPGRLHGEHAGLAPNELQIGGNGPDGLGPPPRHSAAINAAELESASSKREAKSLKSCFVGLDNLPVLEPEYRAHSLGGESVQQTLLARALARRGHEVSMVVGDYGQA